MPDIFYYNDEFVLAFAFKSAKNAIKGVTESANKGTLDISSMIASKKTTLSDKPDHLEQLSKRAIEKIGSLSNKYQVKIAVYVENSNQRNSSLTCQSKEINIKIASQDIPSLFPPTLTRALEHFMAKAVTEVAK